MRHRRVRRVPREGFAVRSKIAVSSNIRTSLLALVASALIVLSVAVPSASAAEGGFEKFFAGNCKEKTCGERAEPPTVKEEEKKDFARLVATSRSA